jgi:hypothetical protein
MKKIPLTKGQFTLVDDSDYAYLTQWRWKAKKQNNKTGKFYACRNVTVNHRSEFLSMHRAIMGVTDSSIHVDHANGDGLDNQRANLRKCPTRSHNNANRQSFSGRKSVYKGVSPKRTKWQAKVGDKYIGVFNTEVLAALAYDRAATAKWGEFAARNFQGRPTRATEDL